MNNTFGTRIRELRKSVGITQKELADYLGYKTSSSVAKIEDGSNDIPISVAARIADYFNVGISSLFIESTNSMEEYASFVRFLPYLSNAKDYQLKAIEDMLGMPSSQEGR